MRQFRFFKKLLIVAAYASIATGCATVPSSAGSNPKDPWESFNRQVFAFNDSVDMFFMRPVAEAYVFATPTPARVNVTNALSNLTDVWIGLNNLLQGKPAEAAGDLGRTLINSTLGILGFFDVATELGLEKHSEDFGQTLAVWGAPSGPYLVLPLLGSSTVRDGFGSIADIYATPDYWLIRDIPIQNTVLAVRTVNKRASLLGASNALEDAALDKYTYMRDFYLRYRQSQINDGRRPRDDDDEGAALVVPIMRTDAEGYFAGRQLLFVRLDMNSPAEQ